MPIHMLATHSHYLSAMAPVWDRIPPGHKGNIYLGTQVRRFHDDALLPTDLTPGDDPVLIAGFDDLKQVNQRPAILMEHGCGQSYGGDHKSARWPAYAGGDGRHGVTMFLCPNDYAAARNRVTHPDTPVEIIGSPRLAALQTISPAPQGDRSVVAVTFHWDAPIAPETRCTFPHWQQAICELASSGRYEVLGHAHPRVFKALAPHYKRMGVEPVQHFENVLERAHVLACDNSTAMYDFAALRGPVVVLDSPRYRPHINHGLRFWDAANIGPRISDPDALPLAIEQALQGPWPAADDILARVYPPVEDPALRAAEACVRAIGTHPTRNRQAATFGARRRIPLSA